MNEDVCNRRVCVVELNIFHSLPIEQKNKQTQHIKTWQNNMMLVYKDVHVFLFCFLCYSFNSSMGINDNFLLESNHMYFTHIMLEGLLGQ